ncbi:acyl-CoA dehydrogenase family protein [Candidatus Pelagibacter ubique]|jgi:alkylation response protein AidB-like acyl-CoA dehydrogenase|uniref:acyl-CoA dehydrogenase C-terminal domain-containing protein n=1 Tax=Pelagibacter ubique TaxID=198252 RepID=UPI0023039AB1|nr:MULTISPECIES: acyl-CoA dehydrogenase family protein [Pelagibacter]MDA7447195.1 acyl-CoA dehydrogenase family protein [Candidatus Pelagibacter ubique]MDA7450286.1 acyl-CoA dehydrogenase family protein [Candidatus Pelagibacter ubique]MDA7452744.1 acyl-CoA dehydrogenase family protein [Candidatus Pelagibacter ubique]MDA7456370.1 acyl-CoA dehydrogenase family protein [Candidatus Pelagibacter ubique]MDA7469189.1 acyl-CoA dehydrogenase family protein [Candidatus Pelagibacter ubique]
MPNYTAPVEDMMFLFDKLRNNKNYNDLEKYKEVNSELVKDILEEAAKINQNLILPLAKSGDENPTVLENGVVRTPPGYKEAYSKYIEDGWTSLSCDPKYGGQGMPKTVSAFFDEMLSSASLSFKLYSELSIGAYNCISHHATDEIKEKYLPKMVEGKWSGTMCLTEPVCGTDLGLLKTKAIEQSDGTFKLSGQKIFITSGDQDLTENIIHLVIARAADSPAGTKGISLFLVPKFLVNEDGSIGARNGVSTGSIESKMGIKGSATCVLNFDDATGYMIGLKNKGLNAMFTMMNLERIVVGIQGLGISEIAYQNSLSYAKERKQGKTNNTKSTNGADFIIEHADIRKSLLNMKSIIEGERALCFWLSQQTEVSLYHPDEKIKQEASDLVSLMTPVVKTMFSDMGMEITSEAMQVHGGYGYTKDQGIEQLYRDNRITPIYEGTNSIQAADLVFRKLVNKNGDIIDKYLELIKNDCSTENEKLKPFIKELKTHLEILSTFTDWIKEKVQNSKDDASAACNDYLKALGFVSIAHAWIKVLEVSFKDYEQNKDFYEDKIQTANFYFKRVLPRAESHFKTATSGSDYIMNFKFS